MKPHLNVPRCGFGLLPIWLFALVVVFSISLPVSALPTRLGDVDEDGALTVLDIVRAVSHIRGTRPLPGDLAVFADINQDGAINNTDVQLISDFVLSDQPPEIPLTRVRETSPGNGDMDVSVTRETVFRLTLPLAPNTVIGNDRLFARV